MSWAVATWRSSRLTREAETKRIISEPLSVVERCYRHGCRPQILHPDCPFGLGTNSTCRGTDPPSRCRDDTGSMLRRRPSLSCTVRRLLHDLVTLARL